MSPRPLGYATLAVLQALADGHKYGFDIGDRTGLATGTVYPALATLTRKGLVTSSWEDEAIAAGAGRPRRRYYALTSDGVEALEEAVRRFHGMGLGRAEPAGDGHA